MISSYFLSERSAINAYTNFNPSVRYAYPGVNTKAGLEVIFWNPPSFNMTLISPMVSRKSLNAGHTASSVERQSPLLWVAFNPDQFPPTLSHRARLRTWRCSQCPSSQSLVSLFSHLCFPLGCKNGLVYSAIQFKLLFCILFLCYLLRISSFNHMGWGLSHLFKHLYMLPVGSLYSQDPPGSLLSGLLNVIPPYILQWYDIHWTNGVV